jgi:hypothetical protein
VFRHPVEILAGWFQPAAVLSHAVLAADDVMVPERLVPEVRKAIENGRLLQELVNEAGVRYVSVLKNEEPSASQK